MRHFFFNAGDASGDDLHVRIALRPALSAATFFDNLVGLGRQYGTIGAAPPLQMIVLSVEHGLGFGLPPPLEAVLVRVMAPLGRLLGYRGTYPEYATRP